jgi:hypothetical protein
MILHQCSRQVRDYLQLGKTLDLDFLDRDERLRVLFSILIFQFVSYLLKGKKLNDNKLLNTLTKTYFDRLYSSESIVPEMGEYEYEY